MQQTTLATSQLGQTGLEITGVGFGAWAIGGGDWEFGWGAQDDAGAIVGFRRPEQVDPLVSAAHLELTPDDLAEIAAA